MPWLALSCACLPEATRRGLPWTSGTHTPIRGRGAPLWGSGQRSHGTTLPAQGAPLYGSPRLDVRTCCAVQGACLWCSTVQHAQAHYRTQQPHLQEGYKGYKTV